MGNVTSKTERGKPEERGKPRELGDKVPGKPDPVLFVDVTNNPIDQPIAIKHLAGAVVLVHSHKESES